MSKNSAQKKDSQEQDEQFVCKYHLSHEQNQIAMVADCKECEGEASLNEQACLTGILNGLAKEYNVDSVVLSHYIETKYADDSMQMLMMMVEILHQFEQMSIREPFKEYFADDESLSSSGKNQQKTTCEKCEFKPEMGFSALKKEFLRDISGFYSELQKFSKRVGTNKQEACAPCIKATKSDLIYLFNKLEDFRAFVIYKGFQIVI